MEIKVGINGFGRIGKLVFRIIEDMRLEGKNIKVVAINCPSITSENLEYLINYDSIHNLKKYDLKKYDDHLIVNNSKIFLLRDRDPNNLNWNDYQAEYIIDSTGVFKTLDKASLHLKEGVKKVLVTCPSKDIPMYVYGVNTDKYDSNQNIVSNASCTTNCLAPICKVINDKYEIDNGFVSTVHSITSSQNTLDGHVSKNIRIGRSSNNIIPSSTGATQALGIVIPELNNKISGLSYRVPTDNVSIIDFSFVTKKETSLSDILNTLQNRSENEFKNIIQLVDLELVSSDYVGNHHSCIIDKKLCQQIGNNFFKIVAWYDNEWGYSCRVVDLLLTIV
jgi:glyceraldehyde 3-phosphate dehydrogenase